MVLPLQHLTDIHRMTCLSGSKLAQTGSIGKTELQEMASAIGQSLDACALYAGNVDFALYRAWYSLGLSWNT
jgi:UDP-N-acetylmuramoylalanine-D-glutamate ligase